MKTTTTNRWGDASNEPLTLDTLRKAMKLMPTVRPPMEFRVVPADRQYRTACDVPLAWVRPKVPAKRAGRRGTRRAWKRAHPPHMTFTYREPDDIIVMSGEAMKVFPGDRPHADVALVTPKQMAAIEAATAERRKGDIGRDFYGTIFGKPAR